MGVRGNGGRVEAGLGQTGHVQLLTVISKQSSRQQSSFVFESHLGNLPDALNIPTRDYRVV